MGHFNPSVAPSWWTYVFKGIYSFHMPAFFFLSGLLYSLTMRKEEGYLPFMWRKVQRLMVPYLCASIVIIGIKLLTQGFMPVKNGVSAFALLQMLWYPSAAFHLWFVWTLLLVFAVARPAGNRRWAIYALLALSTLLWFLPMELPTVFCLNHLPKMLFFFVVGLVAGQTRQPDVPLWLKRVLCMAILIAFVCAETAYLCLTDDPKILSWLTACLGVGTVVILARGIAGCQKGFGVLETIGKCSFFIYLFHTTFMELVKALLPKVGITSDRDFVLMLALAVLVGVVGPLVVQKVVVEKSRVLSFAFGTPCNKKVKQNNKRYNEKD